MKNDKYDEAVDISQSMDPDAFNMAVPKNTNTTQNQSQAKGSGAASMVSSSSSKSFAVKDKQYDEEVEFSGDDDESAPTTKNEMMKPQALHPSSNTNGAGNTNTNSNAPGKAEPLQPTAKPKHKPSAGSDVSSSDEDDDEEAAEGSYEQIDGAYNAKDYANLQVGIYVYYMCIICVFYVYLYVFIDLDMYTNYAPTINIYLHVIDVIGIY